MVSERWASLRAAIPHQTIQFAASGSLGAEHAEVSSEDWHVLMNQYGKRQQHHQDMELSYHAPLAQAMSAIQAHRLGLNDTVAWVETDTVSRSAQASALQ